MNLDGKEIIFICKTIYVSIYIMYTWYYIKRHKNSFVSINFLENIFSDLHVGNKNINKIISCHITAEI